MIIQSNNQSINNKVTHAGPPPKIVYLAWLNVADSIILELWKIRSRLLKSRGAEDRLKTRVELKLFERKLNFWNLIEKNGISKITRKLEFYSLFEDQTFRGWMW